MPDHAVPLLLNPDPRSGYELAVKLSRLAVKMMQPDADFRHELRLDDKGDFTALIIASGVVATQFPTIAQANDFWRRIP